MSVQMWANIIVWLLVSGKKKEKHSDPVCSGSSSSYGRKAVIPSFSKMIKYTHSARGSSGGKKKPVSQMSNSCLWSVIVYWNISPLLKIHIFNLSPKYCNCIKWGESLCLRSNKQITFTSLNNLQFFSVPAAQQQACWHTISAAKTLSNTLINWPASGCRRQSRLRDFVSVRDSLLS